MAEQPIDRTTAQTTVTQSGVSQVRQSHGGALNAGGTRGNKGGRPPSRLRAMCRKMAGTRIQMLGQISSKKSKAKDADKIRAIDVLLKHGLDRSVSIADIRECLRLQSELAYDVLPKDLADDFLSRARDIWASL